jgi:hypothetical protein
LHQDTSAEVIFRNIEIAPSEPEMALTVATSNLYFFEPIKKLEQPEMSA